MTKHATTKNQPLNKYSYFLSKMKIKPNKIRHLIVNLIFYFYFIICIFNQI